MNIANNTPLAPSVDEAPNDVLDPEVIPATGATVRIEPYDDMAFRDHVYLFVGTHYTDDLPISSSAVGKDVVFKVAAKEFVAGADDILPIRYEVQLYQGIRESSDILDLVLQAGFDAEATLDLSAQSYVVAFEKPPLTSPSAARMTREAKWGSAPYTYESSDPTIASVDAQSGEVTALRNGVCTIEATDSQRQAREYPLTVEGIQEVHFLSASADWQGMARVCDAAKLQPITLAQAKRLWTLYFLDTGPVAQYLEWLNYAVWTADDLGGGTAWTYDLNGSSVNGNATGQDTTSFWQVVGVSQA
ncbi:Ig-like domain-containing protein [Pseudomonas sp. LB3P14]